LGLSFWRGFILPDVLAIATELDNKRQQRSGYCSFWLLLLLLPCIKEKKRKKPFYQPTKKTIYIADNAVRDAIHTKDYTDGTLLFGSSTPPLLFDFSFLFGLTGDGHQQHFCVRPFPPGWLAGQ
jgi:hypothetical protein